MSKFNLSLLKRTAAASLFAAAICAVSAAPASALPLYFGYKLGAGGITNQASSTTGGISVNGLVLGSNTITASLTGTPTLAEPNLFSTEFDDRSANAGTVTLYFTETGLGALSHPAGFVTGFSNNSLSTVSVTESSYAQACVVSTCGTTIGSGDVFSTANLLSTLTVAPGGATNSGTVAFPSTIGLGSLYDVTLVYTFTFTGAGNASATITLAPPAGPTGGPGNPVPEPITVSLFGAGVLGAVAMRRRKKAKQA
jgi:hypothetical protein